MEFEVFVVAPDIFAFDSWLEEGFGEFPSFVSVLMSPVKIPFNNPAGLLNGIFTGDIRTETKEGNSPKPSSNQESKANISGATTKTSNSTSKTRPNLELTGGIADDIEGNLTIIPDQDTNSLIIRTS